MNKRTALEIMLMMWDYVALNGGTKENAAEKLNLDVCNHYHYCSCCEYSGYNINDGNCKKCPIKWPITKTGYHDKDTPCCSSYFIQWHDSSLNGQTYNGQKYTRPIAELALETLNRLFPEKY